MKRLVILFLFILSAVAYSQEDSLHLVFTITGDSIEDPIFNCKTLGDINGDGFSDFVVIYRRYAKLYYGSNSFSLSNSIKIEPVDTTNLDNIRIFGVEDINRDGYDDFVFSAIKAVRNPPYPKGIVYFYIGGEEISETSIMQFEDFCLRDALGSSASSGDINGDSYNNIIIGNPYNWCDGIGRVYLFYRADSLSDSPALTFQSGVLSDFFGENICANGDINGDSYDDLIISAPNVNGDPNLFSKVYIYFGKSIISTQPDLIINSSFYSLPLSPFYLPDFNGDGFSDFFITSENKIYFGSSDFTGNDTLKFVSNEQYDNYGETAGYAGDINNDGYSDLILGATGHKNAEGVMVGGAYIYLGSTNPGTTADYFLEGETKWSTFGFNCETLGDINGDGYDEFYIIAPQYPDTTYGDDNVLGKIYVYSMKNFFVDVEKEGQTLPKEFELYQNYPNPFNPSTTIKFALPYTSNIQLTIYDIMGKEIRRFDLINQSSGYSEIVWDGKNNNGVSVSSGIYFYKMEAVSVEGEIKEYTGVSKMLLLK